MAWEPDYVDEESMLDYLRDNALSVDLAEIPGKITAASRAIDGACNRQFGKLDGVATWECPVYPDYGRSRWVVDIPDLMTMNGLVVSVGGTVVTGYRLEPRNASAMGRPWTRLVLDPDQSVPSSADDMVDVTADPFGWAAVPVSVVEATKLQASRFLARRDSPYGIAGSPESGSELRLLARVDPDVRVMLARLHRTRGVG